MTSESSPNTAKKLTSSFSTPEITDSPQQQQIPSSGSNLDALIINKSDGDNDAQRVPGDSGGDGEPTTAGGAGNSVVSPRRSPHSPAISSTLVKSNTVTGPTGAFTTTSITFNSTRDSGFSDSITEDISTTTTTTTSSYNAGGACTVSPGGLVQHILNVSNQPEDVITLHTKLNTDGGRIKLKSVEEDIDIIQPTGDQQNAAAQQPSASGDDQNKSFVTVVKTTKVTTKVNKKTKKNKKGSKNKEENVERDSNSDDQTAPQQTQQAAAASSSSDDNKDQHTTPNLIEIPIVKVDINKSTEEYVFESSPSPVKISSSIITSTTTIAHHHHHHHHHSTASSSCHQHQDLNSTVLDSEEILSSYSPVGGTPHKHLPIVLTKSTEIKIEKEEKKGPVSIPVKDQKQDKKEKKSLKTDNKKKEKKSGATTAADSNQSKSPKTTKCFQLKSSSSKRKAADAASSSQQTTQPSKQLKIDTTQAGSNVTAPTSPAAISPLSGVEEKHVLIDDEQKDRIIYLKPEAVELVVNQLHQQDESLNELSGKSKKTLGKMVSRSLDLLRHDRAESFDKLADRLRTEYKLNEDSSYETLNKKHDALFGKFLKEYLVDQKILLRLPLDKKSAQPIEEIIDFGSKTTGPKRRIVSSGDEDDFEDAKEVPETVQEVKQDQTQLETNVSQVPADEKAQEVSQEPKEAETEQVAPVQAVEPPSDEKQSDEAKVEKNDTDKPDGSHIVLDTIKEPPIVFECDLNPKQPQVKTDSGEPQVAAPTEVSTVVVKATTETPSKDIQKGSKTAKKQGSSLLCCGAISSRKSAEGDQAKKPKAKAAKDKKADKGKKSATAVKTDDSAKVEASKPSESAAPATSTQNREAVHLDFSNLDRKPDEPLATKEPHTIDFPTILDFEIVDPKVVVKEVKKTVVTTTETVTTETKEQEAAPETEKSDKEEGPSTPPTTPTLKKTVDLLPVGDDANLEHQLDRKSLHKALEEAAEAIDDAKKSDDEQAKTPEETDQEQAVRPDAVTAEINVVEKEVKETTTDEQKVETTVVNTFNVKEEAHATVITDKEQVDDHSKQASEETKPPVKLSDDIIKLPDPNDPARLAAIQVIKQDTSASGTASSQAPAASSKAGKKGKKTEKSDDEKESVSCFSCRGKKADKKKKSSDVPKKVSQDQKKTTSPVTPASDQGNKTISVDVADQKKQQAQQSPGILLTGLDPPGPIISAEQQKTLLKIKEKSVSPTRAANTTTQNIITTSSTSGAVLPGDIAQIEIRKSVHTVSTTIIKPIVSPKGDRSSVIQIVESTTTTTSNGDKKQEETVKEYIVDLAPPQITLEEIKKIEEAEVPQVTEPVKVEEVQEVPEVVVEEDKPVEEAKPQEEENKPQEVHEELVNKITEEVQVEKKDDVAVEVEEKVSSPVKLSDDIIKLPDPRDRIDTVAPTSKQEPEASVDASKPAKSSTVVVDKKTKKEKKEAQPKKTSPIDMPLVSVLTPGDDAGTGCGSALACFGKKSKKAKKQKDKVKESKKPSTETTPLKVQETVEVKKPETETPALTVDVGAVTASESTSVSPRQPLEGWSKGLDRAEGEPVVRKDLVENFVAPETKQDQVDEEKPKEEQTQLQSTEEKEPEIPAEVVEEKKDQDLGKDEADKQLTVKVDGEASKLTIDSPGAIIVIDRRPDHPVVPIVVSDRPKVTDAQAGEPATKVVEVKQDDSKAKTDKPGSKDKKSKKEKAKSSRKTNLIDMPLLSCFNPRSTADQDDENKPQAKKPSGKKDKKSKKVETSTKQTVEKPPTPIEIEPLHITADQPDGEQQLKLVISETLNEIVTTVVQSIEQNVTTTTTEIHTKEETDLPQVKPADLNEQEIKVQLDKIEMSSSLIKQPVGLVEDRIKIDREPDIIVLPDPRKKAEVTTPVSDQPVVTITTVTKVEPTSPVKKDGKDAKGHTSLIDMPIIDILVPKGVKKRIEKSKEPKATVTTAVSSKTTKTKTKVQVEKSKPVEKVAKSSGQEIPTEHYVDTFFVDLIEPLPAAADASIKKEKPKKEKKSTSKVEKTETIKSVTKKENEDLVVVITSSPSAEVVVPKHEPTTEETTEKPKQPEAETPEQLPVVEIKSQDEEDKQTDQEVPQTSQVEEKSPEQVLEEQRVIIKDPSDDIVKLPDPNDRVQFLANSSAAQAEPTTTATTSTSPGQKEKQPAGKKDKKKGKEHHTSPLDLPLINCMRKKDSTDSTAEPPVLKVDKKQKAKQEREAKKRADKQHKEQVEIERKERERAEKERVERERREKLELEKAEKERVEREKREKLELERAEKERVERERREKDEQAKAEQEQRAKEERELQLAREAEEAALRVKLEIEEARRRAEEQQVPEPTAEQVDEKQQDEEKPTEELDESSHDGKVEYEPEDKQIKEIEGHIEHVELEPMPLVQEVQPLPAEELEAEIQKLGDEIQEAIKQVEPEVTEEPVQEPEQKQADHEEEHHEPKAPVISEPPPNIPIVTQVIVPKTPELAVQPRTTTSDKSPSKDSVKRTSKIDMPLINILTPKKDKGKKKSQKQETSPKKVDDESAANVKLVEEEIKVVIETVEDDKLPKDPIVIIPPTSLPEEVVVTVTTTADTTPAAIKPGQESKRDKLRREKEEKEAKRRAEIEKKARLEQEKRDLKIKKAAEAKQKKLDAEVKPTTTALDLPLISVVSPDVHAPSESKKTAKQEPTEPVPEVKQTDKQVKTESDDKTKKTTSPIDMPLISIPVKSKKEPKKESSKSDEPTVSCFSCKARKQKKEVAQKQSPTSKQTDAKSSEAGKDSDKTASGHVSPKQVKSPNEGIPLDAPYLESQHTGSEIAKIVKEIQQTEEDHLKSSSAEIKLPEINLSIEKPSVDVEAKDSSLITSQVVTVTESDATQGEDQRIHPDAMEAKITIVESSVTGESTKEVGDKGQEKEVHVLEKTTNKFTVKVEAHATVLTSQKSESSYDDLNDILPQLTINSGEETTTIQSNVKLSDDTPKLTPIDKGKVAASSSVEKAQPPAKSLAKPEVAVTVAKKDDKKKQKKDKSDVEDDSSKVTCFSCKGKKASSSDSSKKPGKKSAKKDQPLSVVVSDNKAAGSASPAASAGAASPRKEVDPELFKNLDQPYDESKKQAAHDEKPTTTTTVTQHVETVIKKETVEENTKDEAHHKEEHTDRVETPTHVQVTEIKSEQNLEKEKDEKLDSSQTVTKKVDVETKETVGPDSHVVETITRTKTTEESNEEHRRITTSLEEIKSEIKTTLTSKADDPENRRGKLSDDPIVLPTREDVKPLVPAVAVTDKPAEPAVATTTAVTTDNKGKKKDTDSSKSKLSCLICCGSKKDDKSKSDKKPKAPTSKPIVVEAKTQQPSVEVAIIESKPVDGAKIELPQVVSTQEIITTTTIEDSSSHAPITPPKKPPRGQLDPEVVIDTSIDTSAPVDHQINITAPVSLPEVKIEVQDGKKSSAATSPSAKPAKSPKQNKTSIIDMPLIDIFRPKQPSTEVKRRHSSKRKSKVETSPDDHLSAESKSPELKVKPSKEVDVNLFRGLDASPSSKPIVSTQQPVKQPTKLIEDQLLVTIDVKGTANELNQSDVEIFVEKTPGKPASKTGQVEVVMVRKKPPTPVPTEESPLVIDLPDVIDVPPSSSPLSSKGTDPLPHVQIGDQKPGDSSTVKSTKSTTKSTTIEATGIVPAVDLKAQVNGSKSDSDYVKLLTTEDKKLVKSKHKEIVAYLKQRSGYTLQQLESSSTASSNKKELKAQEKLAEKIYERCVKVLLKKRDNNKQPLTYTELSKKLEKVASPKHGGQVHIDKAVQTLRAELESGSLLAHFSPRPATSHQTQAASGSAKDADDSTKTKTDLTNSQELNGNGVALRRVPSLTWRQANERARILFYKGRIPSIHYNEKRDSFRVSMITHISTQDGQDKTTEVPVNDEDVRRLLNSYGLYWDGESISLLNKSDEIFASAQREAYEYLQLLQRQRSQEKKSTDEQPAPQQAQQDTTENKSENEENTVEQVVPEEEPKKDGENDKLEEQTPSEENKQE